MKADVTLTRVVTFSSGHRYWREGWSADENRAHYGKWASPYNHGHNFVLSVSAAGEVDPANGMVVNIKDIDDVIRAQVTSAYDQRSINDEVPGFADRSPCLENILVDIAGRLEKLPQAKLTRLRLDETPTLSAEWSRTPEMITLTRTYEFAASHRLHAPGLSVDENVAIFGKCNHVHGHGHNYLLEVTVTGPQDPETGFITSLESLDQVVHKRVVDRYDHRNLNIDIPELDGLNPTSEVVAQAIFMQLEGHVPATLVKIRLHETARNVFEVTASGF